MINKMSKDIAVFLYGKGCFEGNDIEVYAYGLELLIASAVEVMTVLIIGTILSGFTETILYLLTFTALRSFTGGYHAKTHGRCATVYFLVFALSIILYHLMLPSVLMVWLVMLTSALFGGLVIWRLAPVENPNKPIFAERLGRYRIISLVLMAVFLTGGAIMLCFKINQAAIIPIAVDVVVIAMLVEIIKRR